tara:strand:+ start:155959 stop:157353 length:1395 start_codon:yes stop_codon:yes gene_type:complete
MAKGTITLRDWFALIGISLATALFAIDFSIVNTALPAIQKSFSTSLVELRWVIDAFAIVLCAFLITLGRIADVIGETKILYASMAIFVLASLLAGMASNVESLIIARGFQGLAIAGLFPSSLAIVTHIFPKEHKHLAVSLWSGASGIGLALGPALGGFIVHFSSWRWIFLINVPTTIVALLICVFTLRLRHIEKQAMHIDGFGFVFLAIGVSCLIGSILQIPAWGWQSPWVISLFFVGLSSIALVFVHGEKIAYPIIDVKLFSHPDYLRASCVTGLNGFYMYASFFILPLYLHGVLHYSALGVGFMLLPIMLCVAASAYCVGFLTRLMSMQWLLSIQLAILLASTIMQFHFGTEREVTFRITAFVLFGIGWGLMYSTATAYAMSSVPGNAAGVASGMFLTVRNFGGASGLAISGVVFYHIKAAELAQTNLVHAFLSGFHGVMVLLMIAVVLTTVLVWLIPKSNY